MIPSFKVQLLGGFMVTLDGQPLRAFRAAKARALLAYLAAEPDQEHSRDHLATVLWGEFSDPAARTNLRIELSGLKRLLAGHPALEITRTTIRFHSRHARVDWLEFRRDVAAFLALPPVSQATQLPMLTAALGLYQGDFLAGFHVGGAENFDDWQLHKREQTHGLAMDALETLQKQCAAQGHWAGLAAAARRQLALTPWHEPAHRYLIQALAAQGRVQAALTQSERCRTLLQSELGVEPAAATLELEARLRRAMPARQEPRHNLPQQSKPLIGRDQEIAHIHQLVLTQRLVTLVGIGGVGKSRLAQAIASVAFPDFAEGVWFVPLVNVGTGAGATDRIALAIAASIGYPTSHQLTPLVELVEYLAKKRMLLVLDNCEHLAASAATVLELMLTRTAVHVLATSRVRLMVEGERSVPVEGLLPDAAFALFVERARRVAPDFCADGAPGMTAAVQALCAQVAGMPWGIELAASWVEHLSVAEIAESLAARTVAPDWADDLVDCHTRLYWVLDYSWQRLGARHQQIPARLALFSGGFDQAAAAAVADATLGDPSLPLGRSLLQRLRLLEAENSRLRGIVAQQALDLAALKELVAEER